MAWLIHLATTVGAKIVTSLRLARGILLVVVGHSLKMEDEIPQRVLVGRGAWRWPQLRPSSLVSAAAATLECVAMSV